MLNKIEWSFSWRSDGFIFKVLSRYVNVFITYKKNRFTAYLKL